MVWRQRRSSRSHIGSVIAATLLAVPTGCMQSTSSCPSNPSKSKEKFDEPGTSFTEADYDLYAAANGGETGGYSYGVDERYTVAWADLEEDERCRVACAYTQGFTGSGYANFRELKIDECAFEAAADPMVGGGEVSCSGKIVTTPFCEGRRPLGFDDVSLVLHELGRSEQLDACARLEAYSVWAFDQLAIWLEGEGAPASLVQRAKAAAADEARHVDLLVALGAKRPNLAPAPAPDVVPEPSLFELALDNAIEGCVAETWAALLAHHRADHAETAEVREAYAVIARDETRHAQLAWDLHCWYVTALSAEEAHAVHRARAASLVALPEQATRQMLALEPAARRVLGLPTPREAAGLAQDYATRLAA